MTTPAIKCTQPGCDGTIDGGYCDVCGVAAKPASAVGSGPTGSAPAGSGPTGSGTTGGASSSASTPGSAGTASRGRRSRSGATRSSRSSRGSLGAGLIEIPPVPARDPATAVLANPQVPEHKRFCGVCERPVGRGRDGRPGLAEGYCPNCGARFSFSPRLVRGELVAGQYEVLGCLAHGGLGWLYLAMDRNLGNRWVVLKGLLNATDPAAVEAAVAERRFLAEVEHPSIVGVYNFVQHADQGTGEQAGYIVMEYVSGQSLRQLLLDRRQTGESIPLPVALAYVIEVLPALGYLHSRGLVYCDFKPDNVIQTEEQLKLIDMGGVRRIDDEDSAIYGTVGYQAPEIADDGPTPSSDLYTVGRALAVLTFEFTGYQSTYEHSLPDPATVPLLAAQNSFLRALRRATSPDPDQRFDSAAEMADQLTGVLREVLAVADGRPRPAFSTLFSPELRTIGAPTVLADTDTDTDADADADAVAGTLADVRMPLPRPGLPDIVTGLPVPRVDRDDPAAGYLATLGTLEPAQLAAMLSAAVAGEQNTPPAVAESVETALALARAQVVAGDLAGAGHVLASLAEKEPGDWRISWLAGLADLAAGRFSAAAAAFDAVYDTLPGELAPKLALAFTAEAAEDQELATRFFRLVWTIDRSYVGAGFGLARTLLQAGDRAGAITALAGVPDTSSHHLAAQLAAVRIRVLASADRPCVSAADLREAGHGIERLKLDQTALERVTAEVLQAALDRLRASEPLGTGPLLGCDETERSLRFGLERSYRARAQLTSDRRRRTELVDLANSVRPRTWS